MLPINERSQSLHLGKPALDHYGNKLRAVLMKRLLEVNKELNKQNLVSQKTRIYSINMVYILARWASHNINIKAPAN